jgi:hypothetical protein
LRAFKSAAERLDRGCYIENADESGVFEWSYRIRKLSTALETSFFFSCLIWCPWDHFCVSWYQSFKSNNHW